MKKIIKHDNIYFRTDFLGGEELVDDKKLRTYELLGAKVFKKVVLKVEKLKYAIIDKL